MTPEEAAADAEQHALEKLLALDESVLVHHQVEARRKVERCRLALEAAQADLARAVGSFDRIVIAIARKKGVVP